VSAAQKKRRIGVGDWVRIIAVMKDSSWYGNKAGIARIKSCPQQVRFIEYSEADIHRGVATYVALYPGIVYTNNPDHPDYMFNIQPVYVNKVRLQRVEAPHE